MDHVEDRISGLEDKIKTLKTSVKVNNKLMFAMFFGGKKHTNGTCRILDIPYKPKSIN